MDIDIEHIKDIKEVNDVKTNINNDLQTCKGCNKVCKSIMKHLAKSVSCKKAYDLGELKRQLDCVKKDKKKIAMATARANQSEEKKSLTKRKDRTAKASARAKQSEEKKTLSKSKDRTAKASARAKQSEKIKALNNKRIKIAMATARANQSEDTKNINKKQKNLLEKIYQKKKKKKK